MEKSKYKILIVDDNKKNIQVLANLLSEKAYDVEYSLNGPDALGLVASEDFDLILLDIMMPGMNGFEVCEKIKKDKKNGDLPIIFLTAKTDIDSIEKAFESGGFDYVSKPFNSNELLARVKTNIELKVSKDKLKMVNKWLKEKVLERTSELEESMAILESKNKDLEQFAFITSHDLQEPLSTISSFVELFVKEYKDLLDDSATTYLNFITQSTERMKLLIQGLLEYSRIGNEKAIEMVNCNEILRKIEDDLQLTILKKGAKIESEQLPKLEAYPVEIKRLFQNLINNALKYSKQNVPPVINISAQKQDDGWLFRFKDNGIGIEDKFTEIIFTMFQRLHNKNDYGGTGIGLAHCKKIVRLHHGRIWVESKPNNGSVFCFTIKTK